MFVKLGNKPTVKMTTTTRMILTMSSMRMTIRVAEVEAKLSPWRKRKKL